MALSVVPFRSVKDSVLCGGAACIVTPGLPLQVITLDHDKYERELNNIPKSHSKSIQARDNMKLRPVRSDAPKSNLKARLPKLYRPLVEEDAGAPLSCLCASLAHWGISLLSFAESATHHAVMTCHSKLQHSCTCMYTT